MAQGKSQLPDYELDDRLELTTLAQVRAVADPLRGLILDLLLQRSASASDLAAALERPKGTVAYHVKVLREAGVVYIAGAKRPDLARAMGARTSATIEEALREATASIGRTPRVLAVPALSKPAFHLATGGGHTL